MRSRKPGTIKISLEQGTLSPKQPGTGIIGQKTAASRELLYPLVRVPSMINLSTYLLLTLINMVLVLYYTDMSKMTYFVIDFPYLIFQFRNLVVVLFVLVMLFCCTVCVIKTFIHSFIIFFKVLNFPERPTRGGV